MLIDGNKIKNEILEDVKRQVEALSFDPIFCDILVGDDMVSASYVRMKEKIAASIGIKFRQAHFPDSITTEELISEIENLNRVPYMCGIIVQLPLPAHIRKVEVLDAIDPSLDVDCLGTVESNKFYNNEEGLVFPTSLACMKALETTSVDLRDKKIVVLGQGKLVGKPVTHLLRSLNLDVTTINRETPDAEILIKSADVLISAIGHGKFVTGDMIKNGAVIIDAGTSEEDGGVVGDVDFESVQGLASYVSKTPGGVGPITVAYLLSNVLTVAKGKK